MTTKKVIKKRPKKFVTVIIATVFVALSVFLIYKVSVEVSTTYRLNEELKSVNEELAKVEKENLSLSSQKEKLEDPAYVQSYARGNYMFSKEGETIYYLPSNKE